MNLDLASVVIGAVAGAAIATGLCYLRARRARRRREMFESMPLPDTLVYRNAQSVAEWHRKRLEQRISE